MHHLRRGGRLPFCRRAAYGLVTFVAAGSALAAMGTGVGAQSPALIAEFQYDPLTGPAQTSITITGRCLFNPGIPGDQASVLMFHLRDRTNTARVRMTPGRDGAFTGTLTVPAVAEPGAYRLSGSCSLQDQVWGRVTADFTVTGSPTSSTATSASVTTRTGVIGPPTTTPIRPRTDQLAETGRSWPLLILVGIVLSAVGTVTVISSRRSKAQPAADSSSSS